MGKPNKPADLETLHTNHGDALDTLQHAVAEYNNAALRFTAARANFAKAKLDYQAALTERSFCFDAVVLAFNRFHSIDSDWIAVMVETIETKGGE